MHGLFTRVAHCALHSRGLVRLTYRPIDCISLVNVYNNAGQIKKKYSNRYTLLQYVVAIRQSRQPSSVPSRKKKTFFFFLGGILHRFKSQVWLLPVPRQQRFAYAEIWNLGSYILSCRFLIRKCRKAIPPSHGPLVYNIFRPFSFLRGSFSSSLYQKFIREFLASFFNAILFTF